MYGGGRFESKLPQEPKLISQPSRGLLMPAMVFPAPCAACGGEVRKFIEFKAEPCTPGAMGERRYGFRCLTCKTIVDDELVDRNGVKHRWSEGKHVEA